MDYLVVLSPFCVWVELYMDIRKPWSVARCADGMVWFSGGPWPCSARVGIHQKRRGPVFVPQALSFRVGMTVSCWGKAREERRRKKTRFSLVQLLYVDRLFCSNSLWCAWRQYLTFDCIIVTDGIDGKVDTRCCSFAGTFKAISSFLWMVSARRPMADQRMHSLIFCATHYYSFAKEERLWPSLLFYNIYIFFCSVCIALHLLSPHLSSRLIDDLLPFNPPCKGHRQEERRRFMALQKCRHWDDPGRGHHRRTQWRRVNHSHATATRGEEGRGRISQWG